MNPGFVISLTDSDGQSQDIPIAGDTALIGRGKGCAVPLGGWRVGREHARILRTPSGLILEDLGQFSGTWVNGARVVRHGPLRGSDQIQIAGYCLRVHPMHPGVPSTASAAGAATAAPTFGALAPEAPSIGHLAAAGRAPAAPAPTRDGAVLSRGSPAGWGENSPAMARAACPQPALALASGGLMVAPDARGCAATPGRDSAEIAAIHARHPWRQRVHGELLDTIDLRRRDLTRMSDAELRAETSRLLHDILARLPDLPATIDRAALEREVLNEAIGLGPLEELLADDSVTEIMVNRADEIFVERAGRLSWYPLAFTSDRAVMGVIERIVSPLGRRIDESSPLVDARLKDGSRVNAIIPPLALKGPTLTIRKFARQRLSAQDLVGRGSMSADMAAFLRLCVQQRKNLVVSGGTGSGKTTFLNVLSNFIPDGERIITIEDAAELKLDHSHLVSLESRPSNVEGRGSVTIRDLVRNALRMRPDRIVVGECRGGEALDMLQAMNTGHEGSLTTLHANTPRDALSRLETLVLMAGMDLPIGAIREQIAAAVDIIVQQTRFACGSRKITSIAEVTGLENGKLQLQELFRFEPRGYAEGGLVQGRFTACGAVPSFYDELRERGATLDFALFDAAAEAGRG